MNSAYRRLHRPALFPATNKIADRQGSKTNRMRILLEPLEDGRSSFKFFILDQVMVSTSGRPSSGREQLSA